MMSLMWHLCLLSSAHGSRNQRHSFLLALCCDCDTYRCRRGEGREEGRTKRIARVRRWNLAGKNQQASLMLLCGHRHPHRFHAKFHQLHCLADQHLFLPLPLSPSLKCHFPSGKCQNWLRDGARRGGGREATRARDARVNERRKEEGGANANAAHSEIPLDPIWTRPNETR